MGDLLPFLERIVSGSAIVRFLDRDDLTPAEVEDKRAQGVRVISSPPPKQSIRRQELKLQLPRAGETAHAFMRDVLTPLVTANTPEYIKLRGDIFGQYAGLRAMVVSAMGTTARVLRDCTSSARTTTGCLREGAKSYVKPVSAITTTVTTARSTLRPTGRSVSSYFPPCT